MDILAWKLLQLRASLQVFAFLFHLQSVKLVHYYISHFFFCACTQVNCHILEVLSCNDVPCECNSVRIMQMSAPVVAVTESYVPVVSV